MPSGNRSGTRFNLMSCSSSAFPDASWRSTLPAWARRRRTIPRGFGRSVRSPSHQLLEAGLATLSTICFALFSRQANYVGRLEKGNPWEMQSKSPKSLRATIFGNFSFGVSCLFTLRQTRLYLMKRALFFGIDWRDWPRIILSVSAKKKL